MEAEKAMSHLPIRSVSFSPKVEEYHILALDDYSDEEYGNSWYLEEEYHTISQECFKIIMKMTRGKRINKRKYCTRGLERMTPDAQDEKDVLRREAFLAVQEEQSRQKRQGIYNPETIAALYRKATCGTTIITCTEPIELRPLRANDVLIDKALVIVDSLKSKNKGMEAEKAMSHLPIRSVSFSPKVEGYHTLALDDYSDEEYGNSWYLEEEYQTIAQECFKIIMKMTRGKRINKRKYCTRGLERMTPDVQDEKDVLRRGAFLAVQEEQSRQKRQGIYNPETIAALYRSATAKVCH